MNSEQDRLGQPLSDDPASSRLSAPLIRRHNARMDRELARYTELTAEINRVETRIARAEAAEREAARPKLTREDIAGARLVGTTLGWFRVVRVNATSVTVEDEWLDPPRIAFRKVLEVRK